MARSFTKNTANYLSLGTGVLNQLLSGAAKISMAAWVNATSFGTGTFDNAILTCDINGTTTGPHLLIAGASNQVRVHGLSVSTDAGQSADGTTTVPTGAWHHVGGVLNFSGDSNRVYYDGTQETSTAVTYANNAYTPGTATMADAIGTRDVPPGATSMQFNGLIAEAAFWVDDITTTGFAMLAKGYSPLLVMPQSLVAYWPLLGGFSPEIELCAKVNGTITGTVAAAAHCAVLYPAPPLLGDAPVAAAASTLFRKTLAPLGTRTGGRQSRLGA